MPDLELVDVSRLQFAVTAMYHFLFVPLTLGLSFMLVIMESIYVMTKRPIWRTVTRFWGVLFGLLKLFNRWSLDENALEVGTPIAAFSLPDMDGMEVIGRLHRVSALTEAIVLTGNASAFQFKIGSTVIQGDSTTVFKSSTDR